MKEYTETFLAELQLEVDSFKRKVMSYDEETATIMSLRELIQTQKTLLRLQKEEIAYLNGSRKVFMKQAKEARRKLRQLVI